MRQGTALMSPGLSGFQVWGLGADAVGSLRKLVQGFGVLPLLSWSTFWGSSADYLRANCSESTMGPSL